MTVDNKQIKVKLDTGSECNDICYPDFLKDFSNKYNINKADSKLNAYRGGTLKVLGSFFTLCKFKNREPKLLKFYVVDERKEASPVIIGGPALNELNLVKIVHLINIKDNIANQFKELFENRSIIKDFEYDIKLKKGSKGVISACRKVPFAIKNELKLELDNMVKKA